MRARWSGLAMSAVMRSIRRSKDSRPSADTDVIALRVRMQPVQQRLDEVLVEDLRSSSESIDTNGRPYWAATRAEVCVLPVPGCAPMNRAVGAGEGSTPAKTSGRM